jgi:hypothetical protein
MFRFGHFGDKEWKGCIGDWLKSKAGLGFENLSLITKGKEDDDTLISLFEEWGNHWAGGPEFQLAAVALAREATGPILEFGSGLSTLVMAAANPNVQIHCLEADQGWASKLNDVLSQRNITNVTVHVRPLINYPEGRWYDVGEVPRQDYSLVVIDGPARQKGRRDTWFSQMGQYAQSAVWLMDDAEDPAQLRPFKAFSMGRTVHVMGQQRRFGISVPAIELKEAA